MSKKINSTESVELVLPKYDEEAVSKGWDDVLEKFPISIKKVKDWFKDYDVDTIEIYISGVIETDGIMRLVVSAKGEGGLKVVLKPR